MTQQKYDKRTLLVVKKFTNVRLQLCKRLQGIAQCIPLSATYPLRTFSVSKRVEKVRTGYGEGTEVKSGAGSPVYLEE